MSTVEHQELAAQLQETLQRIQDLQDQGCDCAWLDMDPDDLARVTAEQKNKRAAAEEELKTVLLAVQEAAERIKAQEEVEAEILELKAEIKALEQQLSPEELQALEEQLQEQV